MRDLNLTGNQNLHRYMLDSKVWGDEGSKPERQSEFTQVHVR